MKYLLLNGLIGISVLLFNPLAVHAQIKIDELNGSWKFQSDTAEQILIFQDGYCTHTSYQKDQKKFSSTHGGTTSIQNDLLIIMIEFNSATKQEVGKNLSTKISLTNDKLTTNLNGLQQTWTRVDNGNNNLAGCWRINSRSDGNKMNTIKEGSRKTLKILSSTRFQWFAINTETKEFFGTGGGAYRFANGKYTEHIEFFSRDNSRVGAKLSFDADLKNGVWHHSGLSSKGDAINETWVKYSSNK